MIVRPPIVTILGHVDHGKTTLLDYIRQSTIAQKEHGRITQKIGGYEVKCEIKGYPVNKITFIDTPGHEAFSRLRSRGANVADVAILLIDAKDSLMPQTVESIFHIKTANIPMIVALNKIDLPEANSEKVKRDLLKHDILVEGQGGKIPVVSVSAKTGAGVKELLETILLVTSDMNLKTSPTNSLQAFIIETKKDRRGIVVSAIIKDGQINVGDVVYCGPDKIKIRSLIDDNNRLINQVVPSKPFEILGFDKLPEVGSLISDKPQGQNPPDLDKPNSQPAQFNLQTILQQPLTEKQLSLVIKTDSQGSLEAIEGMLSKNEKVNLILKAVGNIHKSDVFLAKTTGSIVIGFNIKPDPEVVQIAKQEKVIIKTYNIIYELINELTEVADLLQEKAAKERNLKGEAKILASFTIEGERVFGVKIIKGKINLADELEIYRNDQMIGRAKLVSLKNRAKKIAEAKKDQEAGMIFSTQLDIHIGDVIKCIL